MLELGRPVCVRVQTTMSPDIHQLMRQFASTTIRATNPTIVVADMIDETAIDLLAARLRTPLQIERHLTMAFEEAYRLGLRPVPSEIAEALLCRQIDDLEPTLTRHGYDVRTLAVKTRPIMTPSDCCACH